jgi:hypothetical protein
MAEEHPAPLSEEELEAQSATPLPDKEVYSLLDLNANLDLGLDLAAPIDLAVAANANVAAPIDAAAGANILSVGSDAGAMADQDALISQRISGEAAAQSDQDAAVDQGADAPATDAPASQDVGQVGSGVLPTNPSDALDGGLLDVNVDVALDADLAAPIAGAVAANANVAAPIDAAVAANIGTIDSDATAIADQDVLIQQELDDVSADAVTDQSADVEQ